MTSDTMRMLLLKLPARRRVYEAIVATPGTHARRLSREIGMAVGNVEHHVRQLERHGLVFAHQDGRRRALFARGQIDHEEAPLIHALRRPMWGALLAELVAGGPSGVTWIASRLEAPPSTVSYHLRLMLEQGLVDNLRVGRESVYMVREPAIARLLEEFRPQERGGAPDAAFDGVVARARLPHHVVL